MIIDAKDFALGVLSSSSSKLSLEEKAVLYETTFSFIQERNKSEIEKDKLEKKEKSKSNMKTFKGSL